MKILNIKKYLFSLILISILISQEVNAQDTTKVLFIGNSFTYYNNMPQLFHDYAKAAHIPIIFDKLIFYSIKVMKKNFLILSAQKNTFRNVVTGFRRHC